MTGATNSFGAASGRPGWNGRRHRRRQGFCVLPLTQQLVHRIFMTDSDTKADFFQQSSVFEGRKRPKNIFPEAAAD